MGCKKEITEGISTSVGIRTTTSPKKIYGAVNISASLLPLVAIPVADAELGGTFYNAKKGKVLHLTMEEMGWKQVPTTIFVDNNRASGIYNSTIKRQQLQSIKRPIFLVDRSG